MNGMALHGGVIPYSGTFFVFTDYMRPAIRLAALMRQRVIHVLTHDSIGLGEDGPTHQPVEHLASLRAMPNVLMFRPADAMETAECWELALRRADGPSLLALSRQALPAMRSDIGENRSARGGYVLAEADGARAVTLIATGSEVAIAMAAREALLGEGIQAAVVSLPCWELFAAQDDAYRAGVLGTVLRVGVEAASGFGWERWLGSDGIFIGMYVCRGDTYVTRDSHVTGYVHGRPVDECTRSRVSKDYVRACGVTVCVRGVGQDSVAQDVCRGGQIQVPVHVGGRGVGCIECTYANEPTWSASTSGSDGHTG
jgi:hypothetical protein